MEIYLSKYLFDKNRSINALAETTIGLFKTEMIEPKGPWKTVSDVELATLTWVDWFNHRRLHGACGDIPPVEFEENYMAELSPT